MLLCWSSESVKIFEVAQLLIENGIEINQTDKDGRNALMLMCWKSNSGKMLEVIQLLITKGIKFNQKDKRGRNAARLLTKNSNVPESKKSEIIALLNM